MRCPTSCQAPCTETHAETETEQTSFNYLKLPKFVGFCPKKKSPFSTRIHLVSTGSTVDLGWKPFTKRLLVSEFVPRHLHLQLRTRRWGSWPHNSLFGFVTGQKQNTYLETSRKPRFTEDFTSPLPAPQPSSVPAATWSSHRGTLFWAHVRMTTASENGVWSQRQICS